MFIVSGFYKLTGKRTGVISHIEDAIQIIPFIPNYSMVDIQVSPKNIN